MIKISVKSKNRKKQVCVCPKSCPKDEWNPISQKDIVCEFSAYHVKAICPRVCQWAQFQTLAFKHDLCLSHELKHQQY